jgi:hypothetical protein
MQRMKLAAEKSDQLFDWGQFRKEIIEEHKYATTETDRVTLLNLHKTLMDSVERQSKFPADDRAEFKKLRSQEYNLLLFREAMIGRTDGLIDPTVMARITAREVAAGRMTPDDEMHTLSVAGAEVLGKLPVQKPISVDAPPTPTAHPSMADRLGQVLSWTASRIKSKLRRP